MGNRDFLSLRRPVPAMLWHGWPDHPHWSHLLLWLLPVARPPSSHWAFQATEVLWYIVAYLWLVALSPPARWLYRRRPLLTTMLPLGVLVVLEVAPPFARESVRSAMEDLPTFGACWTAWSRCSTPVR